LSTGLAAFVLLLLIFTFPETKYHREYILPERIYEEKESLPSEKSMTDKPAPTHDEESNVSRLERARTATTVNVGKGRPGKKQFAAYQEPDSRWKQFLVRDIISPFRVFFYPIIFWAGLMVAGPANLLLLWNLTESQVFGGPPYNWNASQVGYANFSFVVGGLIGLATAGPFSDWVAKRATKKNNGIREAEMRLPALIPYVILTGIGIVIGGIGYERHWAWEVILVVGYGFTGLCVTTVPTIAIAYAIDCYKPISGEIMVVATVLKNTCGFAMSYWVSPLAERKGFFTPAMVQFALTIGPAVFCIPLYFFGKSLRRFTKDSSLHRMEEVL